MMFLLLLLLLTFQKIFFFNRCCCCCFCSPTATALLYCPTPGSRYQDLKIKQEDSWCVLTGTDRPFLHTLLLLCYVERRRRGGRENPSPLLGSPNEAERRSKIPNRTLSLSLSLLPFLFLARRKRNSEELFVVVTATSL